VHNRMSRLVSRLDLLPAPLRAALQSYLLGNRVPFVGTARLKFEEVSGQRVIVSLSNRRRVQNHLKGVHAAAMALLVESATGFALGMHIPDGKIPLLKSLKVNYIKRARGGLRAVAELSAEQVSALLEQNKGEVEIPVSVTDETGRTPIQCEVVWAWIPRKSDQ
jgi:acyl-coenzyme A thioesterase PaaI-like protein